ncbi:apolipoprotein N-acyltransferase [Motiliproteus coralliicola]|uniref:Apolipoprotein N-acyltransferase n=1 Tax=Motiliproteus coralliicola TaxID=2283196 RepID=A0A369WUE6_9GAMM|nr:apolipoprotein N-acyltransferase [Motiliproteus coralliicola]RDE25277.1 apolipoprotein N-acyltransferase [Motiliproteus coralliicola]
MAPLGFAPFDIWPLSILSCTILLACLQASPKPRRAAWIGWLYGVGFYGVGVSWVYVSINQFGNAPPWLAGFLTAAFGLAMALFFALHGYLYRRLIRQAPWSLWLGFAALWILAEWFRSWFLTGFPWLLLGYASIDTWLAGWAPLTGIYGLSGFSALLAAALYLLFRHPGRNSLVRLGLSLLPFVLGALLQQQSWTQPKDASALRVALIQGNIPQELKWHPDYRDQIIDHYLSLSEPLLEEGSRKADLIIWPETAIPLLFHQAQQRLAPFNSQLSRHDTGLISGIPYRSAPQPSSEPTYHNSIMALGSADGLYHKQRLVPFGEYVPLEQWLRGLIDFFDLPMSSFSLGPEQQPPLQLHHRGKALNLSASICYEIVYPDLIASGAEQAELLLTISNDSWFGDSLAPHQHLQMARMRALENGRYLLRATNNGISALIGPDGELLSQGPQFVVDVLSLEARPMTGQTPFTRLGSTPVLCLSLALLGLLHLGRVLPKQRLKDAV